MQNIKKVVYETESEFKINCVKVENCFSTLRDLRESDIQIC